MGLLVAETLLGGPHQRFQLLAAGNHPALRRRPGTETAAQRTHPVIGVGLGGTDPLHAALDAHLPFQGRPEEAHGRPGVGLQLGTLGAVVVSEEGEALIVQPLEQQHSAVGAAVGIDGGQGHGVGFDRQALGFDGLGEPLAKQRQRLGWRLFLGEAVANVFATHIGKAGGHVRLQAESCPQLNRDSRYLAASLVAVARYSAARAGRAFCWVTRISTRRFWLRPSALSLLATGWTPPRPRACRRSCFMPLRRKMEATARARD